MKVVKPSDEDRDVPRGVVGGAEISQATDGRHEHLHGRVPRAARRALAPALPRGLRERGLHALRARSRSRWGDHLEEAVEIGPGDMVYVPPRETHILENLSDAEPAEYVVARDSPTEDSVEVPWAG